MIIFEHSFNDAHSSSNTSTAVSNQVAEWWQTMRLQRPFSVDSFLPHGFPHYYVLTKVIFNDLLLQFHLMSMNVSFLLTQIFICLSLKIKFKVIIVILERCVFFSFFRLHTAYTFMFENRKEKKSDSDNCFKWKELCHLSIKSTTLQMSSLKSRGIIANYKGS